MRQGGHGDRSELHFHMKLITTFCSLIRLLEFPLIVSDSPIFKASVQNFPTISDSNFSSSVAFRVSFNLLWNRSERSRSCWCSSALYQGPDASDFIELFKGHPTKASQDSVLFLAEDFVLVLSCRIRVWITSPARKFMDWKIFLWMYRTRL